MRPTSPPWTFFVQEIMLTPVSNRSSVMLRPISTLAGLKFLNPSFRPFPYALAWEHFFFCANESNSNVEFKGLLTFPQFSLPPRHTLLAPFLSKVTKVVTNPPPTFLYVNQYCHRRPTGSGCSSIDNRRPIFCISETPKLARMYNVLDSFVYSSTSLLWS